MTSSLRIIMILASLVLLSLQANIIDTRNGEPNPSACGPIVCSGVETYDNNVWFDVEAGKVGKGISMKTCGFKRDPVLTVSTKTGVLGESGACPGVFVKDSYSTHFWVHSVGDTTAQQVTGAECDVHWVAVGYNC